MTFCLTGGWGWHRERGEQGGATSKTSFLTKLTSGDIWISLGDTRSSIWIQALPLSSRYQNRSQVAHRSEQTASHKQSGANSIRKGQIEEKDVRKSPTCNTLALKELPRTDNHIKARSRRGKVLQSPV